jgi:hypothetical protein
MHNNGTLRTTHFRSVEETAERYSVRRSWLYSQVAARAIPFLKVGKYLRFDWCALDALFSMEPAT